MFRKNTKKKRTFSRIIFDFVVGIALYISAAIGVIALAEWLFEFIMTSDLPEWVKYLLLK